MSEGKKYDKGKTRYDLVPPRALHEVAQVITFGSAKYGDTNWSKVVPFKARYFAALMRHIMAWWCGQELDEDSGLHHLAHAGACILILLGKHLGDDELLVGKDEV